MTINRVVH